MPITPVTIDNAQQVQAVVSGPSGANRLFIFTGVAIFDFKGTTDGGWRRDFIDFELGPVFPPGQVLAVTATASLNSIKNEHAAGNNGGWAVDRVTARWEASEQRIKLRADLAVRDSDAFIQKVGYQVTVLARV